MGAMNNSPGGCCCEPAGWFDVYFGGSTGKLDRATTLRPNARPAVGFSSSQPGAIDWYIPYYNPALSPILRATYTGFPAFGEKVWSFEKRSVDWWVAQYSSLTKSQLFAVQAPAGFETLVQFPWTSSPFALEALQNGFHSVSQSHLVSCQFQTIGYQDARILFVTNGVVTTHTPIYRSRPVGPNTESVDCISPRNWPRGAGSSTPNANQQTNKVYYGDVVISGDYLEIPNKTLLFDGTTGVPTHYDWLAFDSSPTHWVGYLLKAPIASPSSASFLIMMDGQVVREIANVNSYITAAWNYDLFGEPHVCHPHETLGDGWVLIPTNSYTFNSGDPTKRWEFVAYYNGVESWRTGRIYPYVADDQALNVGPIVHQSSDRWLYLENWANNGRAYGIADHWKHDGTQKFHQGYLTADGQSTIPDIYDPGHATGRVFVTKSNAVVQNSAALGNGLPINFPPA